jgi:hypothetical protein
MVIEITGVGEICKLLNILSVLQFIKASLIPGFPSIFLILLISFKVKGMMLN